MDLDTDMNRNGPHVEAYKNSPIHRAMTNCALFIPRLKKYTKINRLFSVLGESVLVGLPSVQSLLCENLCKLKLFNKLQEAL